MEVTDLTFDGSEGGEGDEGRDARSVGSVGVEEVLGVEDVADDDVRRRFVVGMVDEELVASLDEV